MGQLGPPTPLFLNLDQKIYFPKYFLFILVYPHDKFQNNPVIFNRSRMIFKKMGQLAPPKPPFFSLDQKTYFTNNFYLDQGTPLPNFRFWNQILVDPIRPSFGRK